MAESGVRASAVAGAPTDARVAAAEQRYGTIVVVGGGCYGSYYVRQLTRAKDAGAIGYDRILVVDRDGACRVARRKDGIAAHGAGAGGPPQSEDAFIADVAPHHFDSIVIERAEWAEFFARYLGVGADDPPSVASDAIVPSPLMPHLVYEWLLARARSRWSGGTVRTVALERAPNTPWERRAPDGTHYVSFAEWMCPINCIEPALCPEIKGPRTWSMPAAVAAYVDAERERGARVGGPLLLHCLHRAYGVGMFDTSAVLAADRELSRLVGEGVRRVLVGTVSHCHGALNLMAIGDE